jgi:hypothetical protein
VEIMVGSGSQGTTMTRRARSGLTTGSRAGRQAGELQSPLIALIRISGDQRSLVFRPSRWFLWPSWHVIFLPQIFLPNWPADGAPCGWMAERCRAEKWRHR